MLSKSGLAVTPLPWDRTNAAGWLPAADGLLGDPSVDLWLIAGSIADFTDRAIRFGLSLACLRVAAQRATLPSVVFAGLDGRPLAPSIPPCFDKAKSLGPPCTSWGGQCVAAAMRSHGDRPALPYRLNVIAHPSLGTWFEVGARSDSAWRGAMFGVDEGTITHHGVGASLTLPERCTLEYPLEGMKVEASHRAFTCWAVSNALPPDQSYFVRVDGVPGCILFGEYTNADDQGAWVIDLA
jgi:hypothetical protein